ncbi:hypothetical protein BC833DRAFT_600401 [Globomyces pollinis-pini]|nr:hypothetical protein BC833DRAFT_600401 [Globomyces pollinis-pini]
MKTITILTMLCLSIQAQVCDSIITIKNPTMTCRQFITEYPKFNLTYLQNQYCLCFKSTDYLPISFQFCSNFPNLSRIKCFPDQSKTQVNWIPTVTTSIMKVTDIISTSDGDNRKGLVDNYLIVLFLILAGLFCSIATFILYKVSSKDTIIIQKIMDQTNQDQTQVNPTIVVLKDDGDPPRVKDSRTLNPSNRIADCTNTKQRNVDQTQKSREVSDIHPSQVKFLKEPPEQRLAMIQSTVPLSISQDFKVTNTFEHQNTNQNPTVLDKHTNINVPPRVPIYAIPPRNISQREFRPNALDMTVNTLPKHPRNQLDECLVESYVYSSTNDPALPHRKFAHHKQSSQPKDLKQTGSAHSDDSDKNSGIGGYCYSSKNKSILSGTHSTSTVKYSNFQKPIFKKLDSTTEIVNCTVNGSIISEAGVGLSMMDGQSNEQRLKDGIQNQSIEDYSSFQYTNNSSTDEFHMNSNRMNMIERQLNYFNDKNPYMTLKKPSMIIEESVDMPTDIRSGDESAYYTCDSFVSLDTP